MKPLACLWVLLVGLSGVVLDSGASDDLSGMHGTPHLRRPVAAALCDGGRLLCVANQRSGSVSLIDMEARRVTAEVKIGGGLSDVAALPDGKTLLIADEAQHELLVVRPSAGKVAVIGRVATPRYPVNVVVSDDGRLAAVACLWSHRVAILSIPPDVLGSQISNLKSEISDLKHRVPNVESDISNLKSQIADTTSAEGDWDVRVIRLPFAPRMQAFVSGPELTPQAEEGEQSPSAEDAAADVRRLVVADAFGGKLAVINPCTAKIESVRELPAHNIRGMAVSGDGEQLLLSHQILSPHARADYNDVLWGNLMQNVVRELPLASVLDPGADLLAGSRTIRLGEVGDGAADPAGIAVIPHAHNSQAHGLQPVSLEGWLVALSGVGEVAIGTRTVSAKLEVGRRPRDVVWDDVRRAAYVVCSQDDSIAVVEEGDRPDGEWGVSRISLGPQPAATARDRGERLFFDGQQSHDGWLSCHSCHTDGHTIGQLADTKSDGSYGTPKLILSLLGSRDANPWGWSGRFRELHAQVSASFTSTLHAGTLHAAEINDVVAFLHTLAPPPPVDEGSWTDADLAQIERGRRLFAELGCRACHVPPLTYSIDLVFDVGLRDEAGLSKFNPPTLRGLSQRSRYLHDGRAARLADVFVDHGHQLDRELKPDELDALLAFLRSL